jgi:hypothetical protein
MIFFVNNNAQKTTTRIVFHLFHPSGQTLALYFQNHTKIRHKPTTYIQQNKIKKIKHHIAFRKALFLYS